MCGVGVFLVYALFFAGESGLDINVYTSTHAKIQEVLSSNTHFDTAIFEREDFVSLQKNGGVPVAPSSMTGRTNPFRF